MDNKQYRRILLSFITAIILLGIVIAILLAILNKPKDVQINNYVGQSIKGDKGDPGIQDVPGKDSLSTTTIIEKQTTQVINQITNVPVPGENGKDGVDAAPARQFYQKFVPKNGKCLIKQQYDGDDTWVTVATLLVPCEVGNE